MVLANKLYPVYIQRMQGLNKIIIAILSIFGLLLDGLNDADWCYGISVILWLWLPECSRIETNVLKKLFALKCSICQKHKENIKEVKHIKIDE